MKKMLFMALAVLGAVSCANEQMETGNAAFTIEAVIDNSTTRTHISDNGGRFGMQWSAGDSFALYDGTALHTFTRVGETSQFTAAETPAAAETYYAFYPASAVSEVADGAFKVTLPSSINYTDGNIAPGQFPMSGTGSSTGMTFRNLCALVSFTISADVADQARSLKKATLTASKAICGEASVSFGSDILAITDGSNEVTIECGGLSLSESRTLHFTVPAGTYDSFILRLETKDSKYALIRVNGPFEFQRSVDYSAEMKSLSFCSPFISRIVDVDLAPGQFINTLPAGLDTKESAIAACEAVIVGSTSSYIHLGGWGGSVTVGFDHPILNLEGSDFRGYGNAFEGSSEPGVYYVAQKDASGNPDKWYLIKHCMYDKAIHDYTITYHKPEAETLTQYMFFAWDGTYATKTTSVVKVLFTKNYKEIPSADGEEKWYFYSDKIYKLSSDPTKNPVKLTQANTVSSTANSEAEVPTTYNSMPVVYNYTKTLKAFDNYIYWEDNLGHNGYECKNSYHAQSYWPAYAGETIVITGEYLPTNSFDTSGSGTNYVQDSKWWGFPVNDKGFGQGAWGFVDTYANTSPYSTIDIDWAVDETGKAVHLDHIDFVKVMSATHKQSGWIGEISTEFQGIEDLHLLNQKVVVDTTIVPSAVELVYWTY